VLGLAGFMYPSSGLFPWQEPGRLISRTRGVIPSSVGILFIHSRIANFVTPKFHCLVLFSQFTFTMLTMGKKGKKY
jgi:hypothetical protein